MPDEETGDVFLRHRSVVLAALVPESPQPAVDQDPGDADPVISDAVISDAVHVDSARQMMEAETVPEPRPLSGSVGMGGRTSARSARRSSASDRINALLNGSADAPPTAREFADSSQPTRQRPEAASERSSGPEPRTDRFDALPNRPSGRFDGVTQWVQRVGPMVRNPRILLAAGAVLVVLLVLIIIGTTGGEQPEETQVVASAPQTIAPTSVEPTAEPTSSERIEVQSASSQCPPGSTDGMDAFASEAGKAWSCVRAYNVDGQVLTIDLGGSHTVESIAMVPGWDHIADNGEDEWTKHRTASRVSYQFNDANFTTYTQETLDQRGVVTTEIEPPVTATEITLTILESSGDPSLKDTAVSSVVITGQ